MRNSSSQFVFLLVRRTSNQWQKKTQNEQDSRPPHTCVPYGICLKRRERKTKTKLNSDLFF
jgi:hypothetical protein